MAGLVPAIHAFVTKSETWMPATSAGMTIESSFIRQQKRPRLRTGARFDDDEEA
jgi:hypothetical protein